MEVVMPRSRSGSRIAFLLVLTAISAASPRPAPGRCLTAEDTFASAAAEPFAPSDSRYAAEQRAFRHWQRARRAWREQDWERLLPLLDDLILRHPNSVWEARARSQKGLLRKFFGEWDEAIREFEGVIALAPPQRLRHDVMTSLGCIELSRGRFDEALRLYEDVQRETPDWDQHKYCSLWIREIKRRKALQVAGAFDSCGSRSLAYILGRMGRPATDAQIAASLEPHDRAVLLSLEELRSAAAKFDLNPVGVKVDLAQVSSMPLPVLALVKPGHYVVITGKTDQGFSVLDPDRGEYPWTSEALGRIWTGYALLFGEIPPGISLALADRAEMKRLLGGVCGCCPPTQSGGDVPHTDYSGDFGNDGDDGGGEDDGGGGGGEDGGCGPGMPHLKLNTTSQEWVVEDTDFLYTPGWGPAIRFTRSFNNDSSVEGVFGRGWTHRYQISITVNPNQVQVKRGSGRTDVYLSAGGGNWSPPIGVNDRLYQEADNTWALDVYGERQTYHFAPDGRLDRIEDRNGNALIMEYADEPVEVLGQPGPGLGYLNLPSGITVDAAGSIYLADTFNGRIQKFDANGIPAGQFGEPGTGPGQLALPSDVAVDAAGFVYVADTINHRVQKFTPEGSYDRSWGGQGSGPGQFSSPRGIAVDASGFVYVADEGNHRIQQFDAVGGFLLSWGAYGSLDGQFSFPAGIEVSPTCMGPEPPGPCLYVADRGNNRVQKFDLQGGFLSSFGSYGSGAGQFVGPTAATTDVAGNAYVTEEGNDRVQKFDPLGAFQGSWGSFGGGPAQFRDPVGVAMGLFAEQEQVLVSDTGNSRVQRFDAEGSLLSTFGSPGMGPDEMKNPKGVAIDAAGVRYIADTDNNRILRADASGAFLDPWGSTGSGSGQFQSPRGMLEKDGILYVADQFNHRIVKLNLDGSDAGTLPLPSGAQPSDVALDIEGQIYIVDNTGSQVMKYAADGTYLFGWGSYGTGEMQFQAPVSITVDNAGNLYVLDTNWVRKFTLSGAFVARWAFLTGGFIRFAPDGYLYLTRKDVDQVQRYATSGAFVASWGGPGEDPGEFNNPEGLFVEPNGRISVVDQGNSRLQRFSSSSPTMPLLLGIRDATGGMTAIHYLDTFKVDYIEDPQHHRANFAYDPTNRYLWESTDMAGVTSSFRYDGLGYLTTMTTPGGAWQLEYYSNHRPSYVTNPAGHRYTLGGQLNTLMIDPQGKSIYWFFNADGTTNKRKDKAGWYTRYGYDSHGNRTRITDPEGHVTSWVVDSRGRVTSRTDPELKTTTWSYVDDQQTGRLVSETMTPPPPFSAHVTVKHYDAQENLETVTDAENRVTRMTYYPDGRLHTVTTPSDKTTTYTYDDLLRTVLAAAIRGPESAGVASF